MESPVRNEESSAPAPVAPPSTIPGVSRRVRKLLRLLARALTRISPRWAAKFAALVFTVPLRRPVTARQRATMRRASRFTLPFGSAQLRAYRWGCRGPRVLLLHGWSSRAARLAGFVAPLSDAGFQVIGLDAPAHGASGGLRADIWSYEQAVRLVFERTGRIDAVIAHSFGARAALLSLTSGAARAVGAAVLISSPPDVRYMYEQFKLVLGLRNDVGALLGDELVRRFGELPERVVVGVPGKPAPCPILVVHDTNDEVAPFAHAQAFARRLICGTLLPTRELRHCGVLDDALTIDGIVKFLSARVASAKPHAW
jgi:pimeloyl-ACP methyl ester carboxylesterase